MKRVFLGVMLSLFAMVQSFAVEFIVDGINYAIKGFTNTCMVASNAKAYGSIVIPESVTHNGSLYNVVEIGNEAFRDCYDLTSVVIPNSVTRIGDDAFYGCM